MSSTKKPGRRTFLKLMGAAGVGLVVGVAVTRDRSSPYPSSDLAFEPDAFLQITPDNIINFYPPHNEMGQGIYTGLTTLIAEELDVPPGRVQIRHAKAHAAYVNPEFKLQLTGGSTSMKVRYMPLRQTAANARALLLEAAARTLGAPITELRTSDGSVLWRGESYPYGDFATAAADLELDTDAALKSTPEFRYIGSDITRVDARIKTTGEAVFGLDVEIPDLHRAVLVRCPVIGGKPRSFDAGAALDVDGVTDVVQIFNGVAVVATSYWQAQKAARAIKVEWDYPPLKEQDSAAIRRDFETALDSDGGKEVYASGDVPAALNAAKQVVEASYFAPFLAHATMEPMNCVARIEGGKCDVWVGTQSPQVAEGVAAMHAGLGKRHVTVHPTYLGGGFGRRSMADNVAEAVSIARESGKPVQLIWSREDDTKHDFYRPASLASLKAGLGEDGKISGWSVKRVGPNIMPYMLDDALDGLLPGALPDGAVDWLSKRPHGLFKNLVADPQSAEGLFEDYDIADKRVLHVTRDPGLRTGYWRSVGHSYSAFFKESFMDELALAAGRDPVEFRLAHSRVDESFRGIIELAADKGGWGAASDPGVFRGFAAHTSFLASVAQVAEVSVHDGKIKVHRVVCAIDCGVVVNPDIVRANVESSIVYGLSAALYGEITLSAGKVQQSNFHDYPAMRMSEAPIIEVHIADSRRDPVGVGEPGLPPVAAAVGNAVFAATGQRLRELPLRLV